MKKNTMIIFLIIVCFFIIRISSAYKEHKYIATPTKKVTTHEISTPEKNDFITTHLEGAFIVQGIQWQTTFQSDDITWDTLILTQNESDHSNHLYLSPDIRASFSSNELLPGNTFYFNGEVINIDAGAGNFYYKNTQDGDKIQEFQKIKNADKKQIEEFLVEYNYCEKDEDCTSFYAACPFGCWKGIATKYLSTAQSLIENYRETQASTNGELCEYGCMEIKGVSCNKYQCEVKFR